MPSPVWLDNNDPDVEDFDDLLDDFLLDEYDDYFDQQPSTKRKREKHDGEDPNTPSKRQKLSQPDPGLGNSANASVVIWRTRAHSPIPCPVIDVGSGKGVAILKDWRERSNIRPHDTFNGPESRAYEKSFAVVIERRQPDKGPPAVEPQEILQPRKRNQEPIVNGTSTTASSRAKDKSNREPTSETRPPTLAQEKSSSIPAASKRKRLELDDEEDELQADPSDFAKPKKRPTREPIRQPQPSTRGTVSKARGRKPNPSEPKPPTSTVSTNGKAPKPKASTTSSARDNRNAKVGPTARPSTRKKK